MGRSSISVRPVFVLILAAVATLLLALIIAPFAGSLFAGAVFAVVASPVQRRFSAWFGDRRSLAAGVVTALAALIVVAPLVWLSWSAAEQLGGVYRSVESAYYRGGLDAVAQEVPGPLRPVVERVGELLALEREGIGAGDADEKPEAEAGEKPEAEAGEKPATGGDAAPAREAPLSASQLGAVAKIAGTVFDWLAGLTIDLGMTVLAFFFLLAQGDRLVAWVIDVLPLSHEKTEAMLAEFEDVTRGVFVATVATAAIQSVLGAVGYAIAGVGYLAGAVGLTFLAALVPVLGGAIVVVAFGAWQAAAGEVGYGVFLMIWGVVVVGLSDNFIKPWLAKDSLRLPASVVLFAMLGGLAVFGPMGVVAGPLIVAFFLAALRLLGAETRA